jgi:cytochrome b561
MANNTKYTNVAIALHWLIGIAILFMFILGWFMTELPKEAPKATSFDIFNLGLIIWEVAKRGIP